MLALQDAGCFAIVFEAIPAAVSEELIRQMHVPVIGIGAGPATDGQVLVFHDLLGIREGRAARASYSATRTCSREMNSRALQRTRPTCASDATRRRSTVTRSTRRNSPQFRAELSAMSERPPKA